MRSISALAFLACLLVVSPAAAQDTPQVQNYDPVAKSVADTQQFIAIAKYATTVNEIASYATLVNFLAAIPHPAARVVGTGSSSIQGSGHGGHSDAWWRGVTVCEQSGRNDARYGYFSIMDGSAAGKSWEEQEQIANGIINRYGDHAWASSCVAAGYRASPAG